MSKNPFAGHVRLDKLDLAGPSLVADDLLDVVSNTPGERTLLVEVLRDACFNYCFFGLGRNGTSAEEFWFAVEYLYHVRASKRETWQPARFLREVVQDPETGKRTSRVIELTDSELMMCCLDRQWEFMCMPYPLEEFTEKMKRKRASIVDSNWEQIVGEVQIDPAIRQVLIHPEEPEEMENLLAYLHRPRLRAVERQQERMDLAA